MPESARERLVAAYRELLERTESLAEEAHRRLPLGELLDKAKTTAVEVTTYSREEFDKARYFLRRDIQDMLQHARESEKELADWLRMDLTLVEGRLLDLFVSVADPTRVELSELEVEGFHPDEYLTGEVTGPGVLQCTSCEQRVTFEKLATIPPCPKCHATRFRRPSWRAPG